MKLKDRIKTYNFWVSLSSAIFLIVKVLGQKFNFNVDEGIFSDVVTSLCGILVLLGIIAPPNKKQEPEEKIVTETDDIQNSNDFENEINEPENSEILLTVEQPVENVIIDSANEEENLHVENLTNNKETTELENQKVEFINLFLKQKDNFKDKKEDYLRLLREEIDLLVSEHVE
ncbi:MAG: hypothetical protein IJ538_02150 [Clostridia bacterium]|nr:hypothetical protein [Clostridia bacterium]